MPHDLPGQNGTDDGPNWSIELPFGKDYSECSKAEQKILGKFFVEVVAPYLKRFGHVHGWFLNLDPDEIIQDTATAFVKNWGHFDLAKSKGSLTAYWHKTCNRVVDSHREKAKRELPVCSDFDQAIINDFVKSESRAGDGLEQTEIQQKVHQALLGLSERHRRILELRFISELSYDEIATVMTLSEESEEDDRRKKAAEAARQLCQRARESFTTEYKTLAKRSAVPSYVEGKP